MITRPVFLRTPYSAYDHRKVPKEDEERQRRPGDYDAFGEPALH